MNNAFQQRNKGSKLKKCSKCSEVLLQTYVPVYSPRISLDMMTVKRGAELFTVSAKDTATFFRLIKPRTTVVNLEGHKEDGGV